MEDPQWRIANYPNKTVVLHPLSSKIDKCLEIHKPFGFLSEASTSKYLTCTYIGIKAIIGILGIGKELFLYYVTVSECIGEIKGNPIYNVKEVSVMPLSKASVSEIPDYIYSQAKGIADYFQTGFYYSLTLDLTANFQRIYKIRKNALDSPSSFIDNRYFWNSYMCKPLYDNKLDTKWFTPVIQGNISIATIKHLQLILISRRRHQMGGTRFNNRGIDETGASANFVETEQLIISKEHLYSFIQIRGSIPLFWKQNPTNHQISLSKNVDMCYPYFKKHTKSLQVDYGKIMLVNLLSNHKEGESQLSRILERLISIFNSESHSEHLSKVLYASYDIKAHSNNENLGMIDNFIKFNSLPNLKSTLYKILDELQYLSINTNTSEEITNQKGVIRTNCLDSLDRTNLFQTRIAWIICSKIMEKEGDANLLNEIMPLFNNMWADNADLISRIYSGTISISSNITRFGKQNLKDKISNKFISMKRFIKNNISDDYKEHCIRLLLGYSEDRAQEISPYTKAVHYEKESSNIKIMVTTWNLGGASLPTSKALYTWLIQDKCYPYKFQ